MTRLLFVGSAAFAVSLTILLAFTWASEKNTKPNSEDRAAKPDGNSDENSKAPKELNAEQTELVNRIFGSRLLEIAAEYGSYERVDQTIRWSPTLCSAPPMSPKNLGALSASDSEETHGKKLYYLYARKPWEYKGNVWGFSSASGLREPEVRAPLGQVLVKEAWVPVKVAPAKTGPAKPAINKTNVQAKKSQKPRAYAKDGDTLYHAGDKKGLFIMFKTSEDTPGTDRGWVYGTVSADGKKVTSVGLVKNCMQCHQDAPYDRQIGLSKK